MKSQDSVSYYDHHSKEIAFRALKSKNPAELLPFVQMLKENDRVLDLGCGSGMDLFYLLRQGLQGVGVEASPGLAEIARIQNPGVEILEKNFLFLTLPEASFDGVWANRSLHHFEAEVAQRVVATAFRGLKSGGALGVVVYEGENSFTDRSIDLNGPTRTIYPFTEKAICSMIEQTGFKVLKVGRQGANAEHPLPSLLILANKI